MSESNSVRVFFLHVPKAGGTTVNEAFRPLFAPEAFLDHCESHAQKMRGLVDGEGDFFVSGHIPLRTCAALVARPDIFSFTVLRDAREQLRSHLLWVKSYGAPNAAARRKALEPAIAELAVDLWTTDLNDTRRMAMLMERNIAKGLFDNMQTRYLRSSNPGPVTGACVDDAARNIRKLSFAFVISDAELAHQWLRARYPGLAPFRQENRALIDESIDFEDVEVGAFYDRLIRHDSELVEHCRQISRDRQPERVQGAVKGR